MDGMDENGWKWVEVEVDESEQKWTKVDKLMKVDECGWKWMQVGAISLCLATIESSFFLSFF